MKRTIFLLFIIVLIAACTSPNQKALEFYQSGIQKGEKGDTSGARIDFTKAIELNPNLADAYHNRAFYCFLPAGNLQAALHDFNTAIELYKGQNDAYSLSMRGYTFLLMGKLDEAFNDISASLAKDTSNAYAYRNLAHYYLAKGDTTMACQQLERLSNTASRENTEMKSQNWPTKCAPQSKSKFKSTIIEQRMTGS